MLSWWAIGACECAPIVRRGKVRQSVLTPPRRAAHVRYERQQFAILLDHDMLYQRRNTRLNFLLSLAERAPNRRAGGMFLQR